MAIDVLLATFRPDQKLLDAQISSIRAQRDVNVNLIVHEDERGDGACANFAALLMRSSAEYCAFSDQDDIWLEYKLSRMMKVMRRMEETYGKDTPLLVFSDERVVDGDLRTIDESLFHHSRLSPSRLLPRQLAFQNVGNGNAMLFNAALREKAKPIPPEAFMHDHWISLVSAVFGKTECLREPTVLYRQHDENVLGGPKVGFGYYLRRLRQGREKLRGRLHEYIRQIEAFVARYGDDSPTCFKALVGIESKPWIARAAILLKNRIFKNGLLRNLGTLAVI